LSRLRRKQADYGIALRYLLPGGDQGWNRRALGCFKEGGGMIAKELTAISRLVRAA